MVYQSRREPYWTLAHLYPLFRNVLLSHFTYTDLNSSPRYLVLLVSLILALLTQSLLSMYRQ